MSLPRTLAGITGYIILVGFVVGMVVAGLPSNQGRIQESTDNMRNALNNSVNGTSSQSGFWGFVGTATGVGGVYDFVLGFFQIQIALIQMMLAFVGIYIDIFSAIPPAFYIVFILLLDSLIIGIAKLIMLSGD